MITFVLEMYVLGAAKKAAPNWKHVPLKKYVDFLVLVLSYLMGTYFFNLWSKDFLLQGDRRLALKIFFSFGPNCKLAITLMYLIQKPSKIIKIGIDLEPNSLSNLEKGICHR